ncbi:MAG: hypothetical protein JW757_07280 [Anaerolineales bacterium]|nr:hypothetical protein [Anaerolineales bacterium]
MTRKVLIKNYRTGVLRQSLLVCLLAGGILAALLAGVWTLQAHAQDEGPVCPPGFDWQRMSGVGCVQSDCYDMGGRLSYTSACICDDGLKACTEPVDYSNFDPASCGIFCPGTRLVACVPLDQLCPGEEPPPPPEPDPPITEPEPPIEWETQPSGGILERTEEFITGGNHRPPAPGRAAAAAVTGTIMLGFWSLVQNLGQRSSQVVKSGASGLRQPPKSGVEVPEAPDLRGQAGGLVKDVSSVIDKMPKGSKRDDQAATVLRPIESDSGPAVFYGEEARLILIGMRKLPANTAQSEKMLIGQGGFAALAGRHPGGELQPVRLPSGREVLVDEVLSVGYEDVSPSDTGSVEIDFSPKLVLTARLSGEDLLEAPTLQPPAADPSEAETILRKDRDQDQGGDDQEVQP